MKYVIAWFAIKLLNCAYRLLCFACEDDLDVCLHIEFGDTIMDIPQ